MTPLLLLSLLGLALIIPALSGDDTHDDEDLPLPEPVEEPVEEPVAEDPPVARTPIQGTTGADTLGASSNDTINGGDGDDNLFVDSTFETDENGVETGELANTVMLNGEAGNDSIVSFRGVTNLVAEGGFGDDTINVLDGRGDGLLFSGDGLLLSGNEGNDVLAAEGVNATLNGGTRR